MARPAVADAPAGGPLSGVLSPQALAVLQRSAGNRAVMRLLADVPRPPPRRRVARWPQVEYTGPALLVQEGARWLDSGGHVASDDELRRLIIEDEPRLAVWLEFSWIAPAGDGAEELRHPELGTIMRFRRGRFLFSDWDEAYDQPGPLRKPYGVDILWSRPPPATGGWILAPDSDPLLDAYLRHFPPKPHERIKTSLAPQDKMQLAFALADTTALGELGATFKAALRDPWFIGVTLGLIGLYAALWLAPDFTITKLVAGAVTLVMLALFTWQDLWLFAVAYYDLQTAVAAATTEQELATPADQWIEKLGSVSFDVLLMLAFWGMEKGLGPRVRAGARARARARADVQAAEAKTALGTGAKLPPTPETAGTVAKARAAAGDTPGPSAILDKLAAVLPEDAQRGLVNARAGKGGDAAVLNTLEGIERGNKDAVRYLRERGMSEAELTAAKDAVKAADAKAALARLNQLRGDKQMSIFRRSEIIRLIRVVVEFFGGENLKLRAAIKDGDVVAAIGAIGEVLARAELQAALSGTTNVEVRPDLEVARRVPGYRSIGEWHEAAKKAWREANSQGPEPRSGKMRIRNGDEVWESLAQADNVVVEDPRGQARIAAIDETKTGTQDSPKEAREQVGRFVDELAAIQDGTSTARLFEKHGPQELAGDVTDDYDLSTVRSAIQTVRGLPGRGGFDANLGYDRPTLEAAARELVENGLTDALVPPARPPHPDRERKHGMAP